MKREKSERKAEAKSFKLVPSANDALRRKEFETGKTKMAVLEDLLLGRGLFTPQVEQFITAECARTGFTRWEIIEAAIQAMADAKRIQSDKNYIFSETGADESQVMEQLPQSVENVSRPVPQLAASQRRTKRDAATPEAAPRRRGHPR
jgi:hypothetical protein